MNKKRLLFLSAFFPNPNAPNIATYNRQQLLALTEYYAIDAVVPIPWLSLKCLGLSLSSTLDKIKVYYPTFYYTPFVCRSLYGHYYYLSVNNTVKKLTNTNRYDIVYSSWLYPDAWVAAKMAKRLNIPLYVSVLGTDVNRLIANSHLTRRTLEVAEYANKIICVSNSLKRKLIELGCNREKLVVVQNGVDHSIFHPRSKEDARSKLGICSNDKIILYVGNLKKEKGLGELAHAFSSIVHINGYTNVKLIVIGSGKYKKPLISKLSKLNVLDKTILLGERPLEYISDMMNACDTLCLPSYSEGQPNVIIEALSCHAKVVATTVGGIPDLDDGSGNIKLVPPKKVVELAEALLEMLEKKDDSYNFTPIYSWKDNAACIKHIFDECNISI